MTGYTGVNTIKCKLVESFSSLPRYMKVVKISNMVKT